MKNKNQLEKLDRLLDEISDRLHNEPCPPMPDELIAAPNLDSKIKVATRETKRLIHPGWWLTAAAAVVIACILIGLPQFGRQVVKSDPGVGSHEPGGISIQNLATLEPFASIEQDINEMETEIGRLKKEAALLDAYRKANSLIAQR